MLNGFNPLLFGKAQLTVKSEVTRPDLIRRGLGLCRLL